MAKRRKPFNINSPTYGIHVYSSYYLAASVIVTKYNSRPGTQSLTQILWKSSKTVGIEKHGDLLYTVFIFIQEAIFLVNIEKMFLVRDPSVLEENKWF
uniref:SCP domain-containing protein n=1 Tax=Strongyloides venezuelensis TaxID=75913 RepID=A0A0K0G1Z0_STRVS